MHAIRGTVYVLKLKAVIRRISMTHIYENEYGCLEIEVVGEYQRVAAIESNNFDAGCFFTIDEAEKIALITGNRGIQLGFPSFDLKKAYVLYHQSPSVAAVCRVVRLDFGKGINATKELEHPNPYRGPFFYGI
jgi:hypothetical protein